MKNLLKFLETKTLQDLTTELGISVKEYPEEGLYVLNYSQIDSPKTDPVVMECRGLIINKEFNPVCRPFDRFFNLGEALNVTEGFDFNNSVAYEKADGSLVKVYWWNGFWRVATRGTAFAESENYTGEKFESLILKALGVGDLTELSHALDEVVERGITLIMEYTSPDNRVVTPYKEDSMVLLGARYNTPLGEEYAAIDFIARCLQDEGLNVRAAETYNLDSPEQVKEFVNSLPDLQEGVVCHDKVSGLRLKVKSETYVAVHKLRGECLPTPKRIMGLVVTNETDEYLTYFPEEKSRFTPYMESFKTFRDEVVTVYNKVKSIESQKDFAVTVADYTYKPILFQARKKELCPLKCFDMMDTNMKVKMFNTYLETINA